MTAIKATVTFDEPNDGAMDEATAKAQSMFPGLDVTKQSKVAKTKKEKGEIVDEWYEYTITLAASEKLH